MCQHKAGLTTVEAVQALMTAVFFVIFAGISEREREKSTTAMLFMVQFSSKKNLNASRPFEKCKNV